MSDFVRLFLQAGGIANETSAFVLNQVIYKPEPDQIKTLVQKHWQRGRTYTSKEFCLLWDWRQENGSLKDQACRILLRTLEDKGLLVAEIYSVFMAD